MKTDVFCYKDFREMTVKLHAILNHLERAKRLPLFFLNISDNGILHDMIINITFTKYAEKKMIQKIDHLEI